MHIPISSPVDQAITTFMRSLHIERRPSVGVVNHLNIQPVYDIYANVQGRDLGGVASDIQEIVDKYNKKIGTRKQYHYQRCCFKYEDGFQTAWIRLYFCHYAGLFHHGD